MKKPAFRFTLLLFAFIAAGLLGFLNTSKASASKTDCRHIYDELNLFSSTRKSELEELAKKYSEKRGINFIVFTIAYETEENAGYSDPIYYDTIDASEWFYDSLIESYGDDYEDCIIFTINIVDPNDYNKRYADISGQGDAKIKMDDERCSLLFSRLKSDLSDGDYYGAVLKFLKKGAKYVAISPNLNPESVFLKLWFQILSSLFASMIIILIMAFNSKGKMTVSGANYLDKDNSRILGQYDRYIRTVTTKRKIESSSGGGGGGHGGGGHSGGGSHGGGHF